MRPLAASHLSERILDNSTIFAAEAMAITLTLDYYRHMDPVEHHDVDYPDSMFCLQVIEGDNTEYPLIRRIMNLILALSDNGTYLFLLGAKPLWHWE